MEVMYGSPYRYLISHQRSYVVDLFLHTIALIGCTDNRMRATRRVGSIEGDNLRSMNTNCGSTAQRGLETVISSY